MAIAVEAEVIPLLIGGVMIVNIGELVFGGLILQGSSKKAFKALIGHIVSTLISFYFLLTVLFFSSN